MLTKNKVQKKPNDLNVDVPIHEIIQHYSVISPASTAVIHGNSHLTYFDLDRYSTGLAFFLQSAGVCHGSPVGLYIEKSIDTIIALLAILKSGGIYVPISLEQPKERVKHILNDAGITLIITKSYLLEHLYQIKIKKVIINKNHDYSKYCRTYVKQLAKVNLDDTAYIIYTSGTTGVPKGVIINHRNLLHAYKGWKKEYALSNRDCHLQMANFSFDVFIGDLVRALCSGAKLVLCSKNILIAPKKLYSLMQEEKINCAEFVPAVLRKLVTYIQRHELSLSFMRLLICGSDAWSMKEYRDVQNLCSNKARIINSYGLTETTIDSTFFECINPKSNLPDNKLAPLGKPFPNTEIILLDPALNRVPIGTIGEICIGGGGLAVGYMNQPTLTKEKFIQHPFTNKVNSRLYKTGDLGRVLSDGNIEFLGRADNQIKLNGIRIELSDIENVLNCHPHILECAVITQKKHGGFNKLVAYVVITRNIKLNVSNIQDFLLEKIPKNMWPKEFIQLSNLPLTSNGKIDRKNLRSWKN